mmetsp:Transcript_118524/g.340334  ORF Transcript_118524/g.340334 Transcript_118524/m.340334 type:complete len:801 (+) Transcript_118524:42-2444(+)
MDQPVATRSSSRSRTRKRTESRSFSRPADTVGSDGLAATPSTCDFAADFSHDGRSHYIARMTTAMSMDHSSNDVGGKRSSNLLSTEGTQKDYTTWMAEPKYSRFISPAMAERMFKVQRPLNVLLHHWKFDAAVGSVIVINAVTVGLDQQMRNEERAPSDPLVSALAICEHIFLCVYVTELLMRFFVVGPGCFGDNWVKFDIVLVAMGVMNSWILEPFVFAKGEGLGPLMVLRMGRLLRLARTVRLLVKFQVLWMLVRGLLTSASTMFYTLFLLIFILYLFGCVGFELITANVQQRREDPEYDALVVEWFNDLPCIMLTLLQFVCLDSIGGIYRPLIEKQFILMFYFVGVILVVPIVLMNLVTAVIVNGAIEQADQDRETMASYEEQKRKKMVKDLRKIFLNLDEDGSGMVSREELGHISPEDLLTLQRVTQINNPLDIFNALDVHTTGEMDIESFCNGIWEVAISKVPIEVKRMEMQVNEIFKGYKEHTRQQEQFVTEQARKWRQQTILMERFMERHRLFRAEVRDNIRKIAKAVGVDEDFADGHEIRPGVQGEASPSVPSSLAASPGGEGRDLIVPKSRVASPCEGRDLSVFSSVRSMESQDLPPPQWALDLLAEVRALQRQQSKQATLHEHHSQEDEEEEEQQQLREGVESEREEEEAAEWQHPPPPQGERLQDPPARVHVTLSADSSGRSVGLSTHVKACGKQASAENSSQSVEGTDFDGRRFFTQVSDLTDGPSSPAPGPSLLAPPRPPVLACTPPPSRPTARTVFGDRGGGCPPPGDGGGGVALAARGREDFLGG